MDVFKLERMYAFPRTDTHMRTFAGALAHAHTHIHTLKANSKHVH